jgi:hypothetical protein
MNEATYEQDVYSLGEEIPSYIIHANHCWEIVSVGEVLYIAPVDLKLFSHIHQGTFVYSNDIIQVHMSVCIQI